MLRVPCAQILHLLGEEGPKTADSAKYIRFIYNRVLLENATVRASAVSTLARFGAASEGLRVSQRNTLLVYHWYTCEVYR